MGWSTTGRALIVGLGNPGPRYALTRHNLGFLLVDALSREIDVAVSREKFNARYGAGLAWGRSVVALKPQTFMNLSGASVAPALSFYGLEASQCVVLHDDLDLAFGAVKVKVGGGHGGHNGLRSIIAETGERRDFVRVRLGIGRPPPGCSVVDWVLSPLSDKELEKFDDLSRVGLLALRTLLEEGPTPAMNAVNGLKPPTV